MLFISFASFMVGVSVGFGLSLAALEKDAEIERRRYEKKDK